MRHPVSWLSNAHMSRVVFAAYVAALVLGLLILAGCVSQPTGPQTVPQGLYYTQGQYNAFASVARAYVELPLCRDTLAERCADLKAVQAIQDADRTAQAALEASKPARTGIDADGKAALLTAALDGLRAVLIRYAITGEQP